MGYVMLGHGGLEVASVPEGMEWVAVPAGTTIQFFSDTGQTLMTGGQDLDVFAQLQQPWGAIDSTGVTYNLTLSGAPELDNDQLKNNPSFGGNTLVQAGVGGVPDPIMLCTGTRDTCPTDPRQITAGATHQCDGILAKYPGDLYWIACTVVVGGDQAVVAAARGSAPEDVVIGQNPDVAQDYDADPAVRAPRSNVAAELDLAAMDARNTDVLKALGDGEETHFYQGGTAVLIGDGHSHGALAYLTEQGYAEGTVRIKKGGTFSSGKLVVSNCPDQGTFEDAVGRISDKSVEFE